MNKLTQVVLCISIFVMFFAAGCGDNSTWPAVNSVSSARGPRIVFDSAVYDLGSIGPKTSHNCSFDFKNTG